MLLTSKNVTGTSITPMCEMPNAEDIAWGLPCYTAASNEPEVTGAGGPSAGFIYNSSSVLLGGSCNPVLHCRR